MRSAILLAKTACIQSIYKHEFYIWTILNKFKHGCVAKLRVPRYPTYRNTKPWTKSLNVTCQVFNGCHWLFRLLQLWKELSHKQLSKFQNWRLKLNDTRKWMVDHTSVWDTMVKIFWKFAAPSSISRVYPERDPSAHSRRCSNNLCQTCFGSWDLCGSSLKWKKPVVEKSHPWPTFSANLTSSTFLIWAASKPPYQIYKISTNLESSWHGESKFVFLGYRILFDHCSGWYFMIFFTKGRLNPG